MARFDAAMARWRTGDAAGAAEALAALLREHPSFVPAHAELAALTLARGDVEGAWRRLEPLVPHAAAYPRILHLAEAAEGRLAAQRLERGDAAGAEAIFRAQCRRNPASRTAPRNLAVALEALGRFAEAKAIYAEALARGEDDAALVASMAHAKARECDWDGLDALVARMRVLGNDGPGTVLPQLGVYFDGVDGADQRRWAERWVAGNLGAIPAMPPPPPREPGTPLRVGFLSADFHVHPVARLVIAMFEEHDRERFHFVAFSDAAVRDTPARARFLAAFDEWHDTGAMDEAQVAERMRAARIDVLVEMGGHTKGARLGIAARRPAAVQGHFLGFPGTCGAPFLDFFVGDAISIPPGAERHFTERVLRMPVCCQPNDPRRGLPPAPSRESCGLPAQGIVLASFNQAVKITRPVFASWCRMLRDIPGSVLWLLQLDPAAQANLRAAASSDGIDPARLLFAPIVGPDEHIARCRNADIALDTFPCTSHTTASDMLWAGVPMFTVAGETFAARVAASVLHAAGCGDWVFGDPRALEEAVVALARDPVRLAAAKARLDAARASAPLFDAAAFARAFEALLQSVAISNSPPASRPSTP